MRVGVEPRSRDRDHTVTVKNSALTLSDTLPTMDVRVAAVATAGAYADS